MAAGKRIGDSIGVKNSNGFHVDLRNTDTPQAAAYHSLTNHALALGLSSITLKHKSNIYNL
ncbi:hypothetical protein R50076_31240 [Gilvimarinus japonicus]